MKSKRKFYLAHPFDARKRIRRWEKDFEKRTGIELVNPFYDEVDRTDVEKIDAGRAERYEKLIPSDLVERDVDYIKKSDGVVAFITGDLSYGTIQEMVYAFRYHKPVIAIVTNGHENHPWLQYHSTKVLTSTRKLEEAIKDAVH